MKTPDHLSILIIIAGISLPGTVPVSFAGTFVQSNDLQFSAGSSDQVQVSGTGNDARLQLLSRWQQAPGLQHPAARHLSPPAYLAAQRTAYIFGGWSGTAELSDLWKFSVDGQAWSRVFPYGESLPAGRFGHGLTALDTRRLLLFGGSDDGGTLNNETWIYDTQDNGWTPVFSSTAPAPRAFFAMAQDPIGEKILLFGGKGQEGNVLSDTWVYDIAASSWSRCSPASYPSGRTGAAMAFSPGDRLFYLYGGKDGTAQLKGDLWAYDAADGTWTLRLNTAVSPSPREEAGLFFDTKYERIVLFGGSDFSDTCMYDFDGTVWRTGMPLNMPSVRRSNGIAYVPGNDVALLFGGYDGGFCADTWFFVNRESGTFTATYFDAGTESLSLQWLRLAAAPSSPPPAATLRFQLASSTDNITWGAWCGPDGTAGTFYDGAGSHALWAGHNNCRYLRYRAYLGSSRYFGSPQIDAVTVTCNRSPLPPLPFTPLNGSCTGQQFPVFTWQNPSDPDGDPLAYQLLIGTWAAFTDASIACSTIAAQAGAYTTFASTVPLANGRWYWRVRAFDGTVFGDRSTAFLLFVDTIPPDAVSDLTARTGQGNGEARLTFAITGDDGGTGAITNGFYEVRCATFGPITETVYGQSAGRWQGAIVSTAPGAVLQIDVGGLSDATTYYFALKIADEAGNYSAVSSVAPCAFTNAPPSVTVLSPSGGENWTGTHPVTWNSSDPNGDTVTFAVYASTDSGVSFGVTIATGLAGGTTWYRCDSRAVPNSTQVRIRVRAIDPFGLAGEAVTAADLSVFNSNEAPSVTLLYPAGGETLSGVVTFRWAVSDYNRADAHSFDLALSSDGGHVFFLHLTPDGTGYAFDTRVLPNGPGYRLRVTAADSGNPPLSGEACSAEFFVNNGNLPPNPFSLVSPLNGSFRSPLDFEFTWENNGDPNPEDTLTYTVTFGTSPSAPGTSVGGITGTSYHPDPSLLQEEATCYWKLTARDPLGLETACSQEHWSFVLSRYRTATPDGKVTAEITRGLPPNGYLSIRKEDRSALSLQAAAGDTVGDRHLAGLDEDAYRVAVRAADGSPLDVENPLINVSMHYQGGACYNGTLVPVANLRCALLNETSLRWELTPLPPAVDAGAQRISAELSRCGVITMLGALAPVAKLSPVVNYPNPFCAGKEETRIRYVLTSDGDTQLRFYTLTGDLVEEKSFPAGSEGGKGVPAGYTNEVRWDGRNGAGNIVANGMYILEINSGGERQTRRIGVVK